MLHTIKNEFLSVTADDQGAELNSIVCGGIEFLWQGGPEWWTGRAPVLYPIVGNLNGGSYTHEGRRYSLLNHGFARRSAFTLIRNTGDMIQFSLSSDEDTRKVYPFDFELLVTYELSGFSLQTGFQVINRSGRDLLFSIGGHPAFNCPLCPGEAFEDYEIQFNSRETAGTHIVSHNGLVYDQTLPFLHDSNTIPLTYDLFSQYETLVFSNLNSTAATLRSCKTGTGVAMDFTGFPYFAIWTPPGAPFICLEPWQGVNDPPGFTGELYEKPGITALAQGAEHRCTFTVSLIMPA